MDYRALSFLQLDALREVGNIGAGNAATALSQLLNRKIQISVPNIDVIDLQQLMDFCSEKIVVGVMVRVLGDTPGNIIIIFEKEKAINIIEFLTGNKEKEFSEIGVSVLNEIGNIVASAYMNSITKFTGLNLLPSVPAMAYDMLGAILSTMVLEAAQYEDKVLEIKTNFIGNMETKPIGIINTEDIGADFYYIPKPGSLEKILGALGVN
ncbi:chemotaxis protein CheC [Alloiococcus sp. CFN-8]|uniref:chemotaxis protein CheC n=1 Tax=Alloiococcus sp. CFN-8 TaxID=3416081 RepID=UPI003CF1C038